MKRILTFELVCLIILCSCQGKTPVKIGFLGTLTGSFSDIGISSRNALTLAFEEVNRTGGINGHPLELVVKDDQGNEELSAVLADEFIKEGIRIIFGPTTSSIGLSLIPAFSDRDVLFITSTVSTILLDNLDDNHIKFITVSTRSEKLAHLLFDIKGINQVLFVNDLTNDGFAKSYVDTFRPVFEKRGGTLLPTIDYKREGELSFNELAMKIIDLNPQGVMFLGDNRNTGLTCQQLAQLGYKGFLLSNARTHELIVHGGSSVEGLMLISTYDPDSREKAFLELKGNYEARFAQEMNFSVKRSYEAAYGLIAILKETSHHASVDTLKKAFLDRHTFLGVQGNLEMNEYGDVERPMFMFVIKDGVIKALEETI